MILIALFNSGFALKIFLSNSKKDEIKREKDRKIQLLKILVLDHNLKYFYDIFEKLEMKLHLLERKNLKLNTKKTIEGDISNLFIQLRRKFTDPLLAIDNSFYDRILKTLDDHQSSITNAIFNEGINLSNKEKYNEIISEEHSAVKSDILRILFSYKGD
ncbi:hypothetical protein EHQ24_01665 [Leptospira noumeaensis]|uniref:Uncharacterized protein n=1 Tax=Leptospira noumeaensis TaxID=2484964 RepID=A0A4R9IGN1_9LEPT|nr:hypothetical protein [Leptospira noumeaensis]TGK87578.1 hypothetical protein EHQ24_01665 [Leptospira noumeaensis]